MKAEKLEKFGGQMDPEKLQALRAHAKETGKKFSSILNEMADSFLRNNRVRPQFTTAVEATISKNKKLYEKLAK